jgi:RNA polymerase sigma-70 factor (ECF subfamily)
MKTLKIELDKEFLAIRDVLSSYLYRLTTNKEDMEDLLQDTYLKVNSNIDSFKGDSSFKTWVFAIATNLSRDNKRAKNRWELEVQDKCRDAAVAQKHNQERMIDAFQSQTEKQFEIAEHINYCFTCVAKNLSLEKQIAVILKEVYEFKRSEIAEILKCTESVVKHLLHDGRNELQQKFEQRCALINKKGVCYQCAQLNNYFQEEKNAEEKIAKLPFSFAKSPEENLDVRFKLIHKINPLNSNGSKLEDTILQILREAINDN